MKLKRNTEKSNSEIPQSAGEEFFQLPRAEYLAEEMRASGARQIGDVVANTPLRMDNRLTEPVTDNSMEGAGIRENDYVVVESQVGYPEGCILAVRLGERQLVRRYRRVNGRIHLLCDPPAKQVIIVEEHTPDFRILGQVVQVIREIK